jgi:hypothetical protein
MDIHDEDAELRELCAEVAVCLINATEDFKSCGHCSYCLEIDRLVKFSSRSVIALLRDDATVRASATGCPTNSNLMKSRAGDLRK